MHNVNTKLFIIINNLATMSSFWDMFFLVLTTSVSVALGIIIVLYVVWHSHKTVPDMARGMLAKHREVFAIGITLVATYVLVVGIKTLVALPRPFLVLPSINSLLIYGGNNSFPSNHAAIFAALATSLYPFHRGIGLVVGALALLIGFSRIFVGVHYPLDVIAGFAIGISIAVLVRMILRIPRCAH